MDTPEFRRQKVVAVARNGDANALDFLLDATRDPDPLVREWAIVGILHRRDHSERVLEALAERLRYDPRADVRWYAARCLGKLGSMHPSVEASLVDACRDQDTYVRSFAANALGRLRIDSEPSRNMLKELLLRSPKGTEESLAAGIALARLNTLEPSNPPEAKQLPLFDLDTAPDPTLELTASPKDELVKELHQTSMAVRLDRLGASFVTRVAFHMSIRYARSQSEKERTKLQRGHECQICGFQFMKKDGKPYAEVHHVIPSSEGGDDDQENFLVLCANHHRELHYAAVDWPSGKTSPPDVIINGVRVPIRWHYI